MCFLLAICCSWQPRILRPLLHQPLGLEHTEDEFINVSKLLRWKSRILKCGCFLMLSVFFGKWLMWKKPDLVGLDFISDEASELRLTVQNSNDRCWDKVSCCVTRHSVTLPRQVNVKYFINPCKQTWLAWLSPSLGSTLKPLSTFDHLLFTKAVTLLSVQNSSERYVGI